MGRLAHVCEVLGLLAAGVVVFVLLQLHDQPAQADPGWGLRVVSQKEAPGQQVMTLWRVQTPSGSRACVTANYGTGGSSNRPIWLSCDWGK